MSRRMVIGVMGPGENATSEDSSVAFEIGKIIASLGFPVLTGGRNCGVMEAALKGASDEGGLTIGILPGIYTSKASRYIDIPIITGMGNARNAINVLSSDLVIAIGEGPGTLSEIALAIKLKKPIITFNIPDDLVNSLNRLTHTKLISFEKLDPKTFTEKIENLLGKN